MAAKRSNFASQFEERNAVSVRKKTQGFTLVEMLLVVLVVGILTGVGVGYYSSMTEEINRQTTSESVSAFFAACRERASLRGMAIHPIVTGQGIAIRESNNLLCPLRNLTPESMVLVNGLVFSGTQTFLFDKPVSQIKLDFAIGLGRTHSCTIPFSNP